MQANEFNEPELLMKVVAEMLADYALMFGEKAEAGALKTAEEKYVMSSISFAGTVSGTIRVATTKPFCWVLAANILGIEIDDADAVKNESDALNEFANIACGHFITAAFGRAVTADIRPPKFMEITAEEWKRIAGDSAGGYIIDGEPITASVCMEGAGTHEKSN